MYGYMGKLLFVNLSNGEIETRELPEKWAKDFVGGPALGARVLWEYMPKDTPAFAEASMVGFLSGLLNDTNVFFGGRYTVVSKSPVYNGWNDANSGGYFGPAIRKAGFDGIFVNGISETPVYLWVDDGKAEIRDASFMWGKQISEAEKLLFQTVGDDKVKYAMIGPSGENMAYVSAVMNCEHRTAARGATAAVMGSKNLKAVVCRGKQKVEVYDKQGIAEFNRNLMEKWKPNPGFAGMGQHGTSAGLMGSLIGGDCHVKNWGMSLPETGYAAEQFEELSGLKFNPKYKTKPWGCAACPMHCGAILDVNEGKWPLHHTARPEYETQGVFGPGILNTDPFVLFKCNELCNQYGADTIATGGTLAWAMECFNEGVLKKEQLDGYEPTWGNGEAVVALTEKICQGDGCGKVLQMGSQYASGYYGVGKEYLVLASGIEIPAHDPRRQTAYARTYHLDPTPGRHVKGGLSIAQRTMTPEQRQDYEITGFYDVQETGDIEFQNNSGICRFGAMFMTMNGVYRFAELVTGIPMSLQYRHFLGIRSFTQRQAFNLREGLRRKDFTISPRLIGAPPLQDGPTKGVSIDIDRIGNNFYNAIGYEKDGMLRRDMLELTGGLEHLVAEFYPAANK